MTLQRFRYYRGVRYLAPWKSAPATFARCNTCGRAWDDEKSTGLTPTPSGRCPFEYWHKREPETKPRPLFNLHIEGRRWFRRRYGNTYCSARVFKDGELVATLGPTGGYGDYPLQIAVEWLRKNGHPGMEYGTRYLREEMRGTYTCADVARQRDL